MPELLLELLSEEIPARMQARAAEELKRLVTNELKEVRLTFGRAEAFSTPRRLALVVIDVPANQPDVSQERRGPSLDAADKDVEGFLKSLDVEVPAASSDQSWFTPIRTLQPGGDSIWFDSSTGEVEVSAASTVKGNFVVSRKNLTGKPTAEVLGFPIFKAISKLNWPKSMNWGKNRFSWIRPIKNILLIFDGQPVEGVVRLGRGKPAPTLGGYSSNLVMIQTDKNAPDWENYLPYTDETLGHSLLAPKRFKVKNFADYKEKLKKAKVILDPAERRERIQAGAEKLAQMAGLELKRDPGLLDEVAGLVEWPVARIGGIDKEFMALPPELLTTVMRHHQKYFALIDKKGNLAPRFVVVLNTETRDGGKAAVAGNERVLRARLSDARFFWDQDRKRTLDSRVPELEGRAFHAKLGSMMEKALRIGRLASTLADACAADSTSADRAGRLAKTDLSTGMVGEFPELQGIIGRYYALNDGEKAEVADAIAEHYSPQGPNDDCPSKPVSVAVALADKIDTLVGFWAVGEKPTSSRDPFGLRRAALGVIRLILENEKRVPLNWAFDKAFEFYLRYAERAIILYSSKGFHNAEHKYEFGTAENKFRNMNYESILIGKTTKFTIPGGGQDLLDKDFIAKFNRHDRVIAELLDFFADRLKVHLKERGIRHDLISAVFAARQTEQEYAGEVDLIRVLARVYALEDFLRTDNGANLLIAYRRAANIVRIETKKDRKKYLGIPSEDQLQAKEEIALNGKLLSVESRVSDACKAEDFVKAMSVLAELRKPVDAFFDHVTVNCSDPALRANRLELLARIQWTMNHVADFSAIEGGER